MNLPLFAKALGFGVERAALLSYDDAAKLTGGNEISESISDEASDDWVQLEIMAIQPLTDSHGECIELRIMVCDGRKEMEVYFYARPTIPNAT